MKQIINECFDTERALYGSDGLHIKNCRFTGPADGESALKESKNILAEKCYFNLRYPFWHVTGAKVDRCRLTGKARAGFWYCRDLEIVSSRLCGIKALRECENVNVSNSYIKSNEFGWLCKDISLKDTSIEGEYFMLSSSNIHLENVELKGKYSFQYVNNGIIEDSMLNTKDAFWHARNLHVKNTVIKGEYLGWYSEGLTLENCTIIGTQPLCYCKDLRLINCKMYECDLAFEKSHVEAIITEPIISIKNPLSGYIKAPCVDEIILDDKNSTCKISVGANL
ncbi:MAG: DUF3737 family protein [Clostridia bacterium]|nr:DUF3737 family protein [Clostridia bacterium]